jgi:hypothetical protein
MSNKFNDILQEINNVKVTIDSYSPSIKQPVQLSPLTLAQQKSIIESSADSNLSALFFNSVFFKILKQNVKDDISKYNTIDRVNFALSLRSQLQDSYTFNEIKFSLNEVIEKNKKIEYELKEQEITSDNFTFTVKTPNLVLDDKINNIILSKYKGDNINSSKLKSLISDLFVHEILKFITKVKVNDKEVEMHQDINSAVDLLERIDSSKLTEITRYINSVRDIEKTFATLPGSASSVDIVPDFFII